MQKKINLSVHYFMFKHQKSTGCRCGYQFEIKSTRIVPNLIHIDFSIKEIK